MPKRIITGQEKQIALLAKQQEGQTVGEFRTKLAELFAAEQFEAFVELWLQQMPQLSAFESLPFFRALSAEWRHTSIVRELQARGYY